MTSSADLNHSHEVTLSGDDIDNPPYDYRLIMTSVAGASPHMHTIKITFRDFNAIKSGRSMGFATSPAPADNHRHKFEIKKP